MEYADKFFCDLFGGDNGYQIGHVFAGFVLYIIVMLAFKAMLDYFLNCKKCYEKQKEDKAKSLKTFLFYALSLDYAMSAQQKKSKCNKPTEGEPADQNDLAKYIKWNNRANLAASFVWVVVVSLIVFLTNKVGQSIALGMLVARLLSRVNEVSLAFVDDIGDRKNKSGLTSTQRLKLAVVSLAEEAILFGALYGILACGGKWCTCEFVRGVLHGAYSFVPNINIGKSVAWSISSAYQCVSAMILISLTITSYLSNSKVKTPDGEGTPATDTEGKEENAQGSSTEE